MVVLLVITCFVLCLIGMLGTGSVVADVTEARADIRRLKAQIDTLRLKVDAQETILAEEMAKNEDLKYRLITVQNSYVRTKRDNENLAHRLMRGETNENDEKAG